MKKYLKDFKISYPFVRHSVYDCLNKSRWTRQDTSYFLAEYAIEILDKHNRKHPSKRVVAHYLRDIAYEDRTKLYPLVDYISYRMYQEIINKKMNLKPIEYQKRKDASNGKIREIGISSMKQQCYDYIAVDACKEMFLAKIGHYQCASLKEKGQVFGKRAIETWIRTNPQKCQWIYKCDIHKYYPSVNHQLIENYLMRDIKNDEVLYLLFYLIETYKEGLCIGSYLSQYLANYYLSYLYHYISEQLFTYRRGKRIRLIHHILFYMDDIIMFGSNKKYVKRAVKLINKYLNDNLGLQIKPNAQLFKLDSRDIDMMGYRIRTYKTSIRKRIFDRANRLYRYIQRCNYKMTLHDAYRAISYYGYFVHSWSYKYSKKVKLNKIIKNAKEVISNACRQSCVH